MRHLLSSEDRTLSFALSLRRTASTIALATLLAGVSHGAMAVTDVINDIDNTTNDGTLNFTGATTDISGDTVVDDIVSGSTLTGADLIIGSGNVGVNGVNSLSGGVNAWTLGGAETYTGTTTILNNGVLNLNATNTIADSSALIINQGSKVVLGANNNVNDLQDGTGDAGHAAGGGSVALGAHTLTDNMDSNMGFSGVISGNGNFTTAGTNTLTLSGVNTFTGVATIGAGTTVALSGSGSLATASSVAVAGTFDISATSSGASIKSLSGAGGVTLGSETLTITAGANTFSGDISGGGGLTITGGTETLTGANDYTGATTITSGTLVLDGGGSTIADSASVSIGATGVLTLGDAETINSLSGAAGSLVHNGGFLLTVDQVTGTSKTFAGVINGAGGLTYVGADVTSVLTLSGVNTYTGATTITSGTLALSGSGSIAASSGVADNGTFDISATTAGASIVTLSGSGNVTLGSKTLTLTNAADTFSGDIGHDGGSGGLTISGGSETLTGTNHYTGATTLTGATLVLDGGGSTISASSGVSLDATSVLTLGDAEAINNLSGVSGSLVHNGGFLLTDHQTGNSTFAGVMDGAGGLTLTAGALGNTLDLTGTNTYTGATTVTSGTLELDGGGSTILDSTSVAVGATGKLLLGDAETVNNLSGAAGGLVANGGFLLTDHQTGNTTFAGVASGTGGLTLTAGALGNTLDLTGTNTYTGATTVTSGTLELDGGGSTISASSGVSVANGGKLLLGDAETVNNLSGASGSLVANGGFLLTVNQNQASETFAGVASGTGGFTYNGAAGGDVLTLTATNTYTGATTVEGGTLRITGTNAIASSSGVTVDADATLNLDDTDQQITDLAGAGSVTLDGGTLTMNIDNGSTWTGVISDGSDAGNLIVTNTGVTGNTWVVGGVQTYTGTTEISDNAIVQATVGDVFADSSSVAVDTGGTFDVNGTTQDVNALSGGGSITLGTDGTLITHGTSSFDGVISDTAGGNVEVGDGTLTLTNDNTYTGTTKIDADSTLSIADGAFIGDSSGLIMENDATLSLTGATTVTQGITLDNGTSTIATGTNNVTLSGDIIDGVGDPGVLVKTGSGTLTLSGTNSFSGGINLNAGAVSVATADNLSTGDVAMADGTSLILSGSDTFANNINITGSGTVDSAAANELSGDLSDGGSAGTLVKTGAGTLTLSGDNSDLSGGIDVNVGAISVAAANNLGTGTVALADGTSLILSDSDTFTNHITITGSGTFDSADNNELSGVIADGGSAGTLIKTGAGVLTLSGVNTYTGGTHIEAGTISVAAATGLGSNVSGNTITMDDGTTLQVTAADSFHQDLNLTGTDTFDIGANNVIFTGDITGAGSVVKDGSGQLILTGAAGYTGNTDITSGELQINGDDSSVTGTTTIEAGATLTSGPGTGNIIGGDVVLNGGTIHPGDDPGTLEIVGNFGGTGTLDSELTGGCVGVDGACPTRNGTTGAFAAATSPNTYSILQVDGTATLTDITLALDPIGHAASPSTATKYYRGTTYTFLTAGTLVGTFVGVANGTVLDGTGATGGASGTATAAKINASDDTELAFRITYVSGPDGSATATIQRAELFADAPGATPAEKALGGILDGLQETTTTGSMNKLLNTLSAVTTSQEAGILGTLTGGGINSDMQAASVLGMHEFNGMLAKRLGGDCNTDDFLSNPGSPNSSAHMQMGSTGTASNTSASAWACGYGSFNSVSANDGNPGVDTTMAGTALGFEYKPTGETVVRVGFGYGHDDIGVSGTGATAKTNSLQMGAYGQYNFFNNPQLNAYVGGTLSGGYDFADTSRPTVTGTATASPTAYNLSASALIGFATKVGNVTVEPVASEEYVYNNQDSYSESGGGASDLNVNSNSMNTFRSSVGAQISSSFAMKNGMTLTPQVHAAFIYDAGDVAPSVTESLAGTPFSVSGTNPGHAGIQGGAGMTFDMGSGLAAFADYNGTFKDHETDNFIMGGVKFHW